MKNKFSPLLGEGGSSFWYENWLGTGKLCSRVPFLNISDSMLRLSDVWEGGRWKLESLYTILPNNIMNEIRVVRIPCTPAGRDTLRWT